MPKSGIDSRRQRVERDAVQIVQVVQLVWPNHRNTPSRGLDVPRSGTLIALSLGMCAHARGKVPRRWEAHGDRHRRLAPDAGPWPHHRVSVADRDRARWAGWNAVRLHLGEIARSTAPQPPARRFDTSAPWRPPVAREPSTAARRERASTVGAARNSPAHPWAPAPPDPSRVHAALSLPHLNPRCRAWARPPTSYPSDWKRSSRYPSSTDDDKTCLGHWVDPVMSIT